jgi:hypothetical protein
VDNFYGDKPYARFYALETVARVPYFGARAPPLASVGATRSESERERASERAPLLPRVLLARARRGAARRHARAARRVARSAARRGARRAPRAHAQPTLP